MVPNPLMVGGGSLLCLLLVAGCQKPREDSQLKGSAQASSSVGGASSAKPVVSSKARFPGGSIVRTYPNVHALADCSSEELRACLAPFVKAELDASDIRRLAAAHRCFDLYGTDVLHEAGDCLPLLAGRDAKRRKDLVFAYHCTDICPGYGGVSLSYNGVSADECCELEGEPRFDGAWGGYWGCSPAEEAAQGGMLATTPDGRWQRVVGSSCPGRVPVIHEEWPCEPSPNIWGRGGLLPNARYSPHVQRHPDTDCPRR